MPGTVPRTEDSVVDKIFKQNRNMWGKSQSSLLNPSISLLSLRPLKGPIFKSLQQDLADCHLRPKSDLPPVFVSQVLLEHNHAHCLHMKALWSLSHCNHRAEWL